MKLIASKTFKSSLIMEGSWGEQSLGEHQSVMELYLTEDKTRGFIEWDVPELQELTEIGLWFETYEDETVLTNYDGVFSLPYEAIKMLEEAGIFVSAEFK
jgi:hypothetical protein